MNGSPHAGLGVSLTLTLLHVLWIGFAIALAATAAAWCLRRAAASARYVIHVGGLLLLAASLPATFLLVVAARPIPAESETRAATIPFPTTTVPPAEVRAVPKIETQPAMPTDARAVAPASDEPAPARLPSVSVLASVAPFVAAVYLFGVAAMLVRLGLGLWGGRRLQLSGRAVADPGLLEMAARQARRIGLGLVPLVAWCERVAVPVVVGIAKPTILLPASLATGFEPRQLELLLAHELAHVRRFDLWINLLQRLVEAVLFFHPAAWFLSRRISLERENACDDLVLAAGAGRVQYADALVRMAERSFELRGTRLPENVFLVGATGERPSQFKRRVLRLLEVEGTPRPRITGRGLAAALLVGGSLMGGLAMFHASAQSTTDDNKSEEIPSDNDGWGPVVDGLQARLTLNDGSSEFRPGEVLCLDLWIRNATDKTSGVSLRNPVEWQWTVKDREVQVRGEDRPIQRGDWLPYYELKPGESKLVLRKKPRVLIQPADWKGQPKDYNLPIATLAAGSYLVRATDVHVVKAKAVSDYSAIALPTGPKPIEVLTKEQPRPPVAGRITEDLVRIAWGDAVQGIQAGVAWAADDERNMGEDSCELFFRNASDRELTIGYMAPPWDSWFAFGTDKDGNPLPGCERLEGPVFVGNATLKPGESKRFATPHIHNRNMRPGIFPENSGLVGRVGNVGFPNADGSDAYGGIELKTGLLDFRQRVRTVAQADADSAGAKPEDHKPKDNVPPAPDSTDKKLSFNFRFAPWKDVLAIFAKEADLNLEMNEVPPGKFNYFDREKYTVIDALDILNGHLVQKKTLAVRRDKALIVLSIDKITPDLIPEVTAGELPNRGRYELLSMVIPLDPADAARTTTKVRQLLGPHGRAVPVAETGRLVITDLGLNLRKISKLLADEEAALRKTPLSVRRRPLASSSFRRRSASRRKASNSASPLPASGRRFSRASACRWSWSSAT